MATTEHNVLQVFQDENGDKFILYPITKAELVDGLDDAIANGIAGQGTALSTHTADKNNPHAVTAEQAGAVALGENGAAVSLGAAGLAIGADVLDKYELDASATMDEVLDILSGLVGVSYEKVLKTEIITESCDWVVPADISGTELFVLAFGGGGGGGASASNYPGAGGGGGHMTEATLAVKAGDAISIVIGEGGAGGSASGSVGSAGGFTAVGSNILANGGEGGGDGDFP